MPPQTIPCPVCRQVLLTLTWVANSIERCCCCHEEPNDFYFLQSNCGHWLCSPCSRTLQQYALIAASEHEIAQIETSILLNSQQSINICDIQHELLLIMLTHSNMHGALVNLAECRLFFQRDNEWSFILSCILEQIEAIEILQPIVNRNSPTILLFEKQFIMLCIAAAQHCSSSNKILLCLRIEDSIASFGIYTAMIIDFLYDI